MIENEVVKEKKKRGRKPLPEEILKQHRKDYQAHYYQKDRDRLIQQRKERRSLALDPHRAKRIYSVPREKYQYATIKVVVKGTVRSAHTIGYLSSVMEMDKHMITILRQKGMIPTSPFLSNRGECYTEEMANIVKDIFNKMDSFWISSKSTSLTEDERKIRDNILEAWTALGIFN